MFVHHKFSIAKLDFISLDFAFNAHAVTAGKCVNARQALASALNHTVKNIGKRTFCADCDSGGEHQNLVKLFGAKCLYRHKVD